MKTVSQLRYEDELRRRQSLGVTRYVLTHIGRDGLRTIFGPAQGDNTFPTYEDAKRHMQNVIQNNAPERLAKFCGFPLEVRPCTCWPGHFDPKSIYFDVEESLGES